MLFLFVDRVVCLLFCFLYVAFVVGADLAMHALLQDLQRDVRHRDIAAAARRLVIVIVVVVVVVVVVEVVIIIITIIIITIVVVVVAGIIVIIIFIAAAEAPLTRSRNGRVRMT